MYLNQTKDILPFVYWDTAKESGMLENFTMSPEGNTLFQKMHQRSNLFSSYDIDVHDQNAQYWLLLRDEYWPEDTTKNVK